MKKISLKNLNLQEVEQLSREQLKNVLGGFNGSGTGSGKTYCGGNGGGGEGAPCVTSDGSPGICTSPYKNGWNWGCWKTPVAYQ